MQFFATAAKGTEPALRDELRELRVPRVRADRGGVHFAGQWADGFRVCLASRVALRVLAPRAYFPCHGADDLYAGVSEIDWSEVITPQNTLAVRAACRGSELTHTQFIAQRTKDAIVDQLRHKRGSRPSVDRKDPDLGVFVHLVKNAATVYWDLSGESLHKRGWRRGKGPAPLKETLAAAMLRLSGWDRMSPLVDPLCGSGTLPIEAALWAANVAPGLARRRFGFERWASFDQAQRDSLAELRDELESAIRREVPEIVGSDADARVVEEARHNAKRAGARVRFEVAPFAEVAPAWPTGTLVANPPYGQRLRQPEGFPRELRALLERFSDFDRAILVERGFRLPMPARPSRLQHVFNGDIECDVRVFAARRRSAKR